MPARALHVRPFRLPGLALATLRGMSPASSRGRLHRADRDLLAAARAWLDAHDHAGITVRAFRGRLRLGGRLPPGERYAELARALREASGATSVLPR
jgi:hypothetical protein